MENSETAYLPPPAAPEYALFTKKAITVAAGLGGPLAGAYLMAKNFRTLGREDASRNTLTIAALLTLAFFTAVALVPASVMEKVPRFLLPLIEAWGFYLIIDLYQQKDILAHLNAGGKKGSWRVILGSVLISILVSLAYFAIVVVIFMPD